VFTEYGASFNKGAALNVAYAVMNPTDRVLHFDADILPEPNWRSKAESQFSKGCIHGTRRYSETGSLLKDFKETPYGYFQLWKANDPVLMYWPLFENWHRHAGNYDFEFHDKWPVDNRKLIELHLTHFGIPRANWFGIGQGHDSESLMQMQELHQQGLGRHRRSMRVRNNRLQIPESKLKLAFICGRTNAEYNRVRELLKACMTPNPFLITAMAYVGKVVPTGYRLIQPNVTLAEVKEMVNREYQLDLAPKKGT